MHLKLNREWNIRYVSIVFQVKRYRQITGTKNTFRSPPFVSSASALQGVCDHGGPDNDTISFGSCKNHIKIKFLKFFEIFVTEILDKCLTVVRRS